MMIRATTIRFYLRLLEERNIPFSRLLRGTNIDTHALADPNYLVSLEQHNAAVRNLIRLTGLPDIGFLIGDHADFTDTGIVGYAMLSSRNLRDASQIWMKYSNALLGSPLHVAIKEQTETNWQVEITSLVRQRDLQRFYIEEFLARGGKIV